jgi:hypothetical protein
VGVNGGAMAEQQLRPNRRLWRDIRLQRVAGALLICAIPCTAALVIAGLALFDTESNGEMGFAEFSLVYVIALLIALTCTGLHLGFARIRGFATRPQCLTLGLATGLLCALAFYASIYPYSSSDAVRRLYLVELTKPLAILIALLFIPAGLLSGWIYWRIGIRPRPRAPDNIPRDIDKAGDTLLTPRHRRWRDLHAGRLTLGLCLGPIAMTLLMALIWIADGSMTTGEMIRAGIAIMVFVFAWCLVGGWGYLLVVVRRRRRIGRLECLMLGVITAGLFPLALASLIFSMEGWEGVAPGLDASFAAIVLTTIEALFAVAGLLSGWLFWRFGVRPAPLPHPDVSAVFD